MATGVPGEKVTPITDPDFDTVTIGPTPSSSCLHMTLNGDYNVYSDNAGAGGNNTRLWISGPNDGEVIIGPRGGTDFLGSLRLKTDATTASAANCNISTSGVITRSTSSLKYKQDVQPESLDLGAFRQLQVVTFLDRAEVAARARWDERGPDRDGAEEPPEPRRYVGLVAEQVDELGLTQFVVYHPETGRPDGLMYDRIALGALQLIAEQEERIATLEGQLARLAARVDELHDIGQQGER